MINFTISSYYLFDILDVAIGAPFEDEGSGAVYIYHGSVLGIKTQYVQVC